MSKQALYVRIFVHEVCPCICEQALVVFLQFLDNQTCIKTYWRKIGIKFVYEILARRWTWYAIRHMYKRLWTWFFFFSVERDGCCSYEEPLCVLSPFYNMIVFGAASRYRILSYLQTWIIIVAAELLKTVEETIWATRLSKVLAKFGHWLCAFGYECNIVMHRECPEIYLWVELVQSWQQFSFTNFSEIFTTFRKYWYIWAISSNWLHSNPD